MKEYEVTVPLYGTVTLDVTANSEEEAIEIAMEDCMNLRVDTDGMDIGKGLHVEVLPHLKIVEGNTSFIDTNKVEVNELKEEE
jgi:hypothetical protein